MYVLFLKKNTNYGDNMQFKVSILKFIISLLSSIILAYIVIYYIFYHQENSQIIISKKSIIIEGKEAPRGRIYDKNGILLVDNSMTNNLVFNEVPDVDKNNVAIKLASLFSFSNPSEKEIFLWYKDTHNLSTLISPSERYEIKKRTISYDELINNKISQLLNSLSKEELNIAKAYSLLNSGYKYQAKIIKEKLTDEEIIKVISLNIPGITVETGYERYYPYNDAMRDLFGNIGKIPKEEKELYLKNGYRLDDIIGLSYLEKQYDAFLRGKKAKYLVNPDNTLSILEKEEKGSDLFLTIDINMQMQIEKIIMNNILKGKKYPNTINMRDAYVIVSNPKSGEIYTMAGKRLLDNGIFKDILINNINSSYTVGSVIKGATTSVGFINGVIDPEKKIYDDCVKLKSLTPKCSFKRLGYLNTVKALEQSSNYYQFMIAINLLGKNYAYNMDLNVNESDFRRYRDILEKFGLGIKTGIDIPNEQIGLIGQKVSPDLYLNLAIGQYDTYTPIELITYINTLSDNGKRRVPHLVSKIVKNNKVVWQNNIDVVDKVEIDPNDLEYIKKGFYEVINNPAGTGYGLMNRKLKPAGKTGTSESFFDSNSDGNIDTATITTTMVGYFPYDNPLYSIAIVCPNVSTINTQNEYVYPLSYYISREITDFMFENVIIP